MCGILAIINNKRSLNSKQLHTASAIIRHRGPDDEGFLTWEPGKMEIWAGGDTAQSTKDHWKYRELPADQPFKAGLGHRRLSILDLSPAGHQPMQYEKAGLAVSFNGEIYNYIEIKAELEKLGHQFRTKSDTEVILHAWEQWGVKCLQRFNGMFAILLLDQGKKELYAIRDRFGVKPLYYYKGTNATYLASEIKQIRTSPDYQFDMNIPIARQFLATGAVDHTEDTFDKNIKQLHCGNYLRIDLSKDTVEPEIVQWYTLSPKRWRGSFEEAAEQFRHLLTDAVSLRLRSDVKVGTALSGGLDSSSIVCIAADLLKARGDHAGQETVTACFDEEKYDEWRFAQEVVKKTNAHPHRVFPSFDSMREELDAFVWHQDEPVASTSVFSQWAVFKASRAAGLTVMIDGQGADEQLAGYGGNDLPLYAGLMQKARFRSLLAEARSYKTANKAWPKGFLLGAFKINMGKRTLPERLNWLQGTEPASIYDGPAHSLQRNLFRQIYRQPLPALLRYEDHNSMAWSVESRTPFMDYRLMEFNLGLPERFVYKDGLRKTILRKAMHKIIPESIENRKDKMGFVTPEETWLKGEGKAWFLSAIDYSCKVFKDIINEDLLKKHVHNIIEGKEPFSTIPWRVVSLGLWHKNVTADHLHL